MSKASRRALRTAAGSINARLHRAPSAERFSPQKIRAGRNASSGNLQRQRGIERGPVVAAHPPDLPLRHRVKLGRVLVVLLPHRTPVVDREPAGFRQSRMARLLLAMSFGRFGRTHCILAAHFLYFPITMQTTILS